MKYVTISDIAKALNMSKSTVSRALHDDALNVSLDTRRRVQEAAERMGFRPNLSAANLSKQSSDTIGIVVPEMETSFYPTFIQTAQRLLRQRGYRVSLAQSGENAEEERENLLMMIDYHVDGILLSVCDGEQNKDLYRQLVAHGLPLVFFDRKVSAVEAPQVLSDDHNSSFFLTEELIRLGRRRIVHFRGPASILNSADRLDGYRQALEKWHLPYSEELVVDGGVGFRDGELAALQLLESGVSFDAIHGFTEMSLLGAKSVLQSRGMKIPDDVAIACMSGTNLCKIVHPKVTAVEQNTTEMAARAVGILLDGIAGKPVPQDPVYLATQRIDRESTLGVQ